MISFQEFLAAKQIKETKQEQLLLDNWQEQWWRGTILLYAALVNPSNLIRSLIALNNEEATTLALRCLEETPRKIDPQIEAELTSLQSNVQNLLYQPLETFLKNEQWREADEETFKVMLKVAAREEQGSLDKNSINNFPGEDLRIIDQLWLKYSKNKWGFSVQKEIYESLGGTKKYNEEVFRNLCEGIGWRKEGGSLQKYSDLIFNLELAPQAHLPYVGVLALGGDELRLESDYKEGMVLMTSFFYSIDDLKREIEELNRENSFKGNRRIKIYRGRECKMTD